MNIETHLQHDIHIPSNLHTHTCVYTYNSTSVYINIYKYVLRNFNMLNSKKHTVKVWWAKIWVENLRPTCCGDVASRLVYFGWSPFPGFQSPPGLLYLWCLFFFFRTGDSIKNKIYYAASSTQNIGEGINKNNIWKEYQKEILPRTKSSRTWEGSTDPRYIYLHLVDFEW